MRKTKEVTIEIEGRDKGKTFIITEMPALEVERWAARALQGLTASGVDLPENVTAGGGAALAAYGVQALSRIEFSTLDALLAEMLACVQVREPAIVRRLTGDDIEEVSTLLLLRREWFGMHFGFFVAAAQSLMPPGKMKPQAAAPIQ